MKSLKIVIRHLFILSFYFFTVISCDKKNMTEPVQNQLPIIASLTANPADLDWGTTSQLVVIAVDPEAQVLAYSWASTGGVFITSPTNDTVTWQAPDSSGSFICTVMVSDGENTVSENITISVTEHPILSVNKDTLAFGSTTGILNFTIINNGTGILSWSTDVTTDDGAAWISSILPSNGSLATNEPEQVSVEVDRSGLAGGTYSGWVNVFSNDGIDSLRAILDVARLEVSPISLDFGPTATNLTFDIRNSGGGTLTWTISDDETWLSVSPDTGSTATETDQISVIVDRSGLSEGTYDGRITVNSIAGSAIINIYIQVPQLGEWITYDDGSFENGGKCTTSGYLVVRFTRPSGWSNAQVTKVKIYIDSGSNEEFRIKGWDDYNYSQGYYWPSGSSITLKNYTSQSIGWNEHNVNYIFTSRQFFVGIYHSSTEYPYLGVDEGAFCAGRSYFKCGGGSWNLLLSGSDFGVQVYVEQPALTVTSKGAMNNDYAQDEEKNESGIWLGSLDCFLIDTNGELVMTKTVSKQERMK